MDATSLGLPPAWAGIDLGPGSVAAGRILHLTGFVPQACAYTLAELQQLPSRMLGTTEIVCLTGEQVARADSYRGVALIDLLAQTGLGNVSRHALKECMIIARGSDGYRALFSWNELYNTPVGDGVIVVYERDGDALDPHLGPCALISASDLRTGPRHLRQLCEIKVLRISG
ncbi:MAG: molybdopterin-dependent oxidoreductase [Proteobacteria bacterium]|nr:molybdopterin-dependent oxidoreductase [Pseudomonadota bacterium]